MGLDRKLQREILEQLAEHYPAGRLQFLEKGMQEDERMRYIANLVYLDSHGLIAAGLQRSVDGFYMSSGTSITHKGMDFLADDGGLTAILGTVTVKLHDDTIRHLLEARIDASDLPEEDKKGWREKLRELRGESIKHLTMKLLDKGAESLPAILDAIQTSL